MVLNMYCTEICSLLNSMLLSGELYGKVHSIFCSSINVILDNGKIITILNTSKPVVPYAVKTDYNDSFKDLDISMDEQVLLTKNRLRFKHFYIIIDRPKLINMSYEVYCYTKPDYQLYKTKLKALKYYLLLSGNTNGILSIVTDIESYIKKGVVTKNKDNNFYMILPRILTLIDAFRLKNLDKLSKLSSNCAGFGVGLTPSTDDFLCGMMSSILYGNILSPYEYKYFADILKKMTSDIRDKTTIISENFLINSGNGVFPMTVKSLVSELYSEKPFDKDSFHLLLKNVIHFGETSGTDIMCGIYIGSLVITYYFGGRGNE